MVKKLLFPDAGQDDALLQKFVLIITPLAGRKPYYLDIATNPEFFKELLLE
jgi:hypothetical protein